MKNEIELEKVICPCCGNKVPKSKYCCECGQKLDETVITSKNEDKPINNAITLEQTSISTSSKPKALSDKGLTLLVNTCRKTIATVGGDGYSEIVLYQDESTGEYWLHTYSKYEYMNLEEHASYKASYKLAEKVRHYIEDHNLASWKNNRGFPLAGGDYIIRFKHGDEYIRLDSGNMLDGLKAYYEIDSMLHLEAIEENRRYEGQ